MPRHHALPPTQWRLSSCRSTLFLGLPGQPCAATFSNHAMQLKRLTKNLGNLADSHVSQAAVAAAESKAQAAVGRVQHATQQREVELMGQPEGLG